MTVRTLIFAETSFSRQQKDERATASTTQHRAGDMPVRKMIRGNGTGSITPGMAGVQRAASPLCRSRAAALAQ